MILYVNHSLTFPQFFPQQKKQLKYLLYYNAEHHSVIYIKWMKMPMCKLGKVRETN